MKNGKKPRFPRINIDPGRPGMVISGMEDAEDGTLRLLGEDGKPTHPAECYIDMIYERKGKTPKVVSRVWVDPAVLQQNPNRALQRYGQIFAVDTNTHAGSVGLTSITWLRNLAFVGPRYTAQLCAQPVLEFHGATTTHERIGWWTAIASVLHTPEVPKGQADRAHRRSRPRRDCGHQSQTLTSNRGTLASIGHGADLRECRQERLHLQHRNARV